MIVIKLSVIQDVKIMQMKRYGVKMKVYELVQKDEDGYRTSLGLYMTEELCMEEIWKMGAEGHSLKGEDTVTWFLPDDGHSIYPITIESRIVEEEE